MTKALVSITLLLVLAAIALAVGVLPQAPEAPAIPAFPDRLADLPLTQHAQNTHTIDHYNALNMPEMFDQGKCRSYTIAYCPKDQAYHVVCEVHKDFYVGIIVGMAFPDNPVIVTAYPGELAYWKSNISGCVDATFPPFGMALP